MKQQTWPTEDGGEFCIAGAAIDWEMNAHRRLSDFYFYELDQIGGPQMRLVKLPDAMRCYLSALRRLAAEIEKELAASANPTRKDEP